MPELEKKEEEVVKLEDNISSKSTFESKKFIIITVVILIIVIALGALSYYSQKDDQVDNIQPPPKENNEQETPDIVAPSVLHNLRGTIKEFDEGNIIMEAEIPQVNQGGELISLVEIKKVLITPDTKIVKQSFGIHEPTGKKIVQEEDLVFGSLQVGDSIEVLSGENLRTEKEFEVSKIRLLEQ